jgi:hypothetical protein
VFVIAPGVDGSVTVSVNVAVAPLASVPALQVTVVVPLHAPAGVDDCSVVPAGSVSVTVTDDAVVGPPFVTPIVYVSALPVPYGPGAGVFVIERSASAAEIVVIAVELLLPEFVSPAVVTVAVLLLGPIGAATATFATMSNVAVVPFVSVAIEQETVPVPPTAGFVHVNEGPPVCVSETKVVFGGSVSLMFAAVASDGPLFVTTTWYVTLLPAVAAAGAVLTTERSALVVTVVVAVELLFNGLLSVVVVETFAVFEIVPVAPALM